MHIGGSGGAGSALDMMIVGSFVVMGLITLLFYFVRRRELAPLWLGLFCFTLASHFLFGKHALSWYVSLPLLALFIQALYPIPASRPVVRTIIVVGGVAAAAALVLPVPLLDSLAPVMEVATLASAAWLAYVLASVSWHRRSVWPALLAGMPLLYPVMMLDLLAGNAALRFAFAPLGLAAFIIAPVVVLSRRIARALDAEELRSQEEREHVNRLGEALRNQEKFTDDLLDSVPVALSLRDASGRYLFVNRAWEQWFGSRRDQVLGNRVQDRFSAEVAERVLELDRAAIDRGPGALAEMTDFEFNGRRYTQTRSVMADAQGRVVGLLTATLDTTERRRQEQQLRDQMVLTRALIDENPNAMYLKDTQARYVTVNDAWLRMVGLTREQAIGRDVREIFGDAESERYYAEDMRLLAQGRGASEVESKRTGPDGEPQWLIVRKAVLRRADGEVIGLIGTNTDVTPLKRYEIELAEQKKILETTLENIDQGITMVDKDLRAIAVNRRFFELLDFPRERFGPRGFSLEEAFRYNAERGEYGPGDIEEQVRTRMELARKFEPHAFERRRPNGQVLAIRGQPLPGGAGFVTTYTDITEQKRAEEELKASVALREEVERMSRHDLKTPINSVIAVSRMLRENRKLATEDAELLATVERAGYRILSMVNLSLDLFRMEQGTYEFHPRPVDLDEVAAKVATDLQSQAASKHVYVQVKRKRSAVAHAEELLCYSIFANLVKNAIEAAPENTDVSIELDREGESVFARVHNVGEVPLHLRPRFFRKYATAGKSAGLGLGAYSAHLLARVQGGDLALASSESEGTTLTVRLQAASDAAVQAKRDATPTPAEAGAMPELPRLRVLVADDDEFNRLVLRRYLPSPMKVSLAVNGRAAVDAAADEWPDVVLLDLEMPVMDGYEAARRLRAMEREKHRKRVLIVAISANDDEAIVKRALAAGCDHYLVKPAPRELLWKILAGANVPLASGGMGAVEARPSDDVLLDPDLEAALPGFLASRRDALDEMARALEAGDREAFKHLAHRLAGSFALYGFRWAATQSKALEHDGAGGDAAELGARTARLRAHLDEVKIRVATKDTVSP